MDAIKFRISVGQPPITDESQKTRGETFAQHLGNNQQAPYHHMADSNNYITYKGVTFFCNTKENALCLGNTGDRKNTLNIPLSGGGVLRVNKDNLGDLSRAIGMFSPEDANQIMRALAQEAKVKSTRQELEEDINSLGTEKQPIEKTEE